MSTRGERAAAGGTRGTFGRGGDPDARRPEDPVVRRANTRRILSLFRPYRRSLAILLALIAGTAAISTIPAFLLRELLDGVFAESAHDRHDAASTCWSRAWSPSRS